MSGSTPSQGPRLSPTSYLVLGLISLRGPSTPYELKRAAGRSVAFFWPFPHTQFYAEPERLHQLGLLDLEGEKTGRRRKTYRLTPGGREALSHWLAIPPDTIFEVRDMAVLQLFFGEFMSTQDLKELARKQVELCDERLAVYKQLREHNASRMEQGRRMAPLTLGLRLTTTMRTFWLEIENNPPQ
ncbi:transcriptional regulator, PadR-like family [Parafrankia sp. EAN1pec]|uniref:PadR family transcriptional regulator n=1 Tax=Parafrankia sp. (strain EAN1pec) TaxID=298653 RepID=UPI0000540A17|nr:transcriptional regulator, PadR-like family [Frankia sp. EAN1pec]